MSDFPLDDATLVLLDAACRINPDSGHTELGTFLEMGTRVARVTNEETGETYADMEAAQEDVDDGDVPVFFVEHEPGYEPYSPQHVICCLVAEIQRLRAAATRSDT